EGESGDRGAGRGEAQLRVRGEIAHHGHHRLARHVAPVTLRRNTPTVPRHPGRAGTRTSRKNPDDAPEATTAAAQVAESGSGRGQRAGCPTSPGCPRTGEGTFPVRGRIRPGGHIRGPELKGAMRPRGGPSGWCRPRGCGCRGR